MPLSKRSRTRKTASRARAKLYEALVRSEAQLRATLYSIGDAVIATDSQGRVVMMNPVAEQLTGWREDDARGKPLADVFHIVNEETRAPVEDPVTRVLREGTVIGLANHTLLLARDGREIPIADAGAPIFDARRKIVGVVLVFRDQTAERAAQRAVQEAREYAESIVATARDPLIVLDANLRVVSANRAFYHVFATTPAETEGRLLYELGNRQWDIPELRRLLEEILSQNTSFDDYRVTHDFECIGTRTMLLNARRIHREGKADLILLAIEDITARKQHERELEAQARIAQALGETQELQPLLERLIAAAIHAIPAAEKGSLLLADEQGTLHIRAVYGYTDPRVQTARFPTDSGYAARAFRERRALIINDVRADATLRYDGEITEMATIQSAIVAPLFVQDRPIGVLALDNTRHPAAFDEHDLHILTNIATTAALIIERRRLFEETQRHAEKIVAVNALGRALATTLDLPTLCRTAYQHIRTLVACDNLCITLYNAETRTLRPAYVISEGQELDVSLFPPLTIDPHAPRAGRAQAILDAQTVVLNDLAEKSRQSGRILVGSATEPQSAAYTPMLVKGKVIGLLELQSYRNYAYAPDDLDLLQMIANQIGLAIQNARLFQEAYDYLHELQTLYQAGLELGSLLEPRAIGAKIIEVLQRRMRWQHAVVRVRRDNSDELETIGYGAPALTPEQIPAEIERLNRLISRVGQGLTGWVIQHGVSVRCGDVSNDPRYVETYPGIRSGVYAPIRLGERVLGAIGVESDQPNAFDESAERFLCTLATQAASALENARLFAETRARVRELEVIAAVSRALSAASTRAEMYTAVLDQLVPALNVDGGLIETLDPASGELLIQAVRGVGESLIGRRIPRGASLSAYVLETGKPYFNNDARSDPLLFDAQVFGECRAAAGVPMRIGTQILGLVWLASRRALTDDDVRVLTAIADITANALHRAALNEQTEHQVRRLSALRAIDRVISSSFDLRITLAIILEHTLTELKVDAVNVLVHHPHTHVLEYAASRGFRTRAVERTRVHCGEGLAGQVALDRQVIHLTNLANHAADAIIKELVDEGYTEYYGVPLIAKGNVVGVMEIFNRTPLPRDPEWREFCETLAGQAAIAIDNARLFGELQQSHTDLILAYDATIEGWSRALELRDKETEGHTERVTEMTLRLARAFGFREDEIVHIRRGALMHDIGKIAIPDAILHKPGKLTDEEWTLMREHPRRAYEMLLPIAYLRPALDIPYCHHERWDGTGYPRGLKGEEIPLAARLFAVVDMFDALISDRPYRQAWSREQACEYIRQQAGKCFDPRVVEVFLQMIKDE